MINIHLLSRFPPEMLSYCMNQSPIHYFSITEAEAKLFQYINKFHSNGILADNRQLDYSKLSSTYITPLMPFIYFYQFISSHSQFIKNNGLSIPSKHNQPNIGNYILWKVEYLSPEAISSESLFNLLMTYGTKSRAF
jgi:hypothetical protein